VFPPSFPASSVSSDYLGVLVKGTKRFKAGAWRLEVDAGTDPVTGRRRRLNRTVRAPNNKRGERQADTELAKLVVEARAQLALPSTGVTTEELVERYIVSRSTRWAPGAADATRRRVAQHITPHIGAVAIERLRPIDVEHWHATLRAAGVSEGSIGRVHDILRAALNWGERLELIGRNPAVKVDRPRGTKPVITPPAPADIVRMIAEASVSLALFLRLAALTGARRGQLCGLHWSDVDLDAATIRWTRSLAKVPGGVVEKETKTGARWPIAIDPATVDLLRTHRRRCAESALAAGVTLSAGAYVFARDPAGRLPWHPDGASQRFGSLRDRLGLEAVRLHDLRHWMATEGLGDGVDIETVAGRGGWANTTTPLEIYSHFRPARDTELARRLAQRLDDKAASDGG
jgi:integrase